MDFKPLYSTPLEKCKVDYTRIIDIQNSPYPLAIPMANSITVPSTE